MRSGSATRKRACISISYRNGSPAPLKALPSTRDRSRSGSQANILKEKILSLMRSRSRVEDGRTHQELEQRPSQNEREIGRVFGIIDAIHRLLRARVFIRLSSNRLRFGHVQHSGQDGLAAPRFRIGGAVVVITLKTITCSLLEHRSGATQALLPAMGLFEASCRVPFACMTLLM